MIQDSDVFRYPGVSNDLLQFFPKIWTMKSCSNQNRDVVSRDSPSFQFCYNGFKKKLVRNWPSDVTDQNTGSFIALRFFRELFAADWLR